MPLEVPNERRPTVDGYSPPYFYTGLFDEEQKSFEIVGECAHVNLGAKAKAEFQARTCKRFALVGGVRRMQAVDNPNISRATYLRALRAMQRHDDRMGIPREPIAPTWREWLVRQSIAPALMSNVKRGSGDGSGELS